MKYLVETHLIEKKTKAGRATKWKISKRIIVAASHEEAGEIDDSENTREYGIADYGLRITKLVPSGIIEMHQLELPYEEAASSLIKESVRI